MRFVPTRIHGLADYLTGLLLIASPYLFGFAQGGIAQWLPMALGVAMLGLALLTDYEVGLMRVIPMPVHLGIDLVGGVLLAASPWLFGFSDRVYLPHLLFGLLELGAALTTRTQPDGTAELGRV